MPQQTRAHTPQKKKGESRLAPLLCNVLGILLIVVTLGLVLPLSLPPLLGYEVFEVVDNNMEPVIPAESVVYVRPTEAGDITEGDVIAYQDSEAGLVVTRVIGILADTGEFVTQGDADDVDDPRDAESAETPDATATNPADPTNELTDPVAVSNTVIPTNVVIGRVVMTVPLLGHVMAVYATDVGKIYVIIALACGFMLNILADRLRVVRSQHMLKRLQAELAARQAGAGAGSSTLSAELAAAALPRRGAWVRTVVMTVLAVLFVGSAGVIVYVQHSYQISGQVYRDASATYVQVKEEQPEPTVAPIEVDFDALRAVNEDVVGWIYCEGTIINYPVLQGETNDTYLHHDYLREYNIDGSIFVDADNSPGFVDASTIIYGHHMNYGTYGKMFEGLDEWANQAYYEQHPVMWLLTPEQDYQIVLVSGHHADVNSDTYNIYHKHDDAFKRFLKDGIAQSDFMPLEGVTYSEDDTYVMLSTCAYIFEGARYVLHGKLVPVGSAGGVVL